jgi:hypothetical protein
VPHFDDKAKKIVSEQGFSINGVKDDDLRICAQFSAGNLLPVEEAKGNFEPRTLAIPPRRKAGG